MPSNGNWLSPDKYKSPPILHPNDSGTRAKYFTIYQDYISLHMTHAQLAEKYDYHPKHIHRIIKWVAFEMGEFDPDAQLQALVDKTLLRQQEIELMIQNTQSDKVRVSLYGELRKHDMFIAKLQGLITNSIVDNSDRSKNITVITNPNMKRGQRDGESGTDEEREIEAELIEISEEPGGFGDREDDSGFDPVEE